MPLSYIKLRPGVNTQLTQTANAGGFSSCNLVRWQLGLLQKIGGWARLFGQTTAGIVRAMHDYLDLLNNKNLLIGADEGPQVYIQGSGLKSFQLITNSSVTVPGTATNGSNAVTFNYSVAFPVGTKFFTTITIALGGVLLPPGEYTVSAVAYSPSSGGDWLYTFNMPNTATSTAAQQLPLFTFNTGTNADVTVNLPNHGLSVSQTFPIQATTLVTLTTASGTINVTIPNGANLLVKSVVDANNFTFAIAPYGTSALGVSIQNIEEGSTLIGAGVVSPTVLLWVVAPSFVSNQWFVDNLGTNGLYCYTNSPIYVYTPPYSQNPYLFNIGFLSNTSQATAPQINSGIFVAMPEAQLIAFGSEPVLGTLVQDPLLLRFSDAGGYSVWTATASNQAGSFRLGGSGSRIVGGIQAPQTSLIFTDVDLWSMQYIGPPLVYGFTVMGTGCGLVAPHAMGVLGRNTYWEAVDGFYVFGDSGVQPFLCPVWDQFFPLIDQTNINKCFCAVNSLFNEVSFFAPEIGGDGECSIYVKVNLENPSNPLWDYGTMPRSAWTNQSVFGPPLGADPTTLLIQQHEMGYDADDVAMSGVFAETGYSDLSDGDQIMFASEFVPDMKWFGNMANAAANVNLKFIGYPTDPTNATNNFSFTPLTQFAPLRVRARSVAMRIEWVARLGFSGRLGTPRVRVAPDGKRP